MSAPTKTVLPFVGGGTWYNTNREYRLDTSQTTSTAVFYELYTNGNGDVQFGVEIRNDNKMYVMTSNNTPSNPHVVTLGNFVSGQDSVTIANGNRVSLYHSDQTLLAQIDVDTTMLWTSNTSTEGVATLEWQGSFSKNPGNDLWRWNVTGYNTGAADYISLYDYLPTLSSTEPAIGTRTFAASSSSTSQYGLFTPDMTKTYYIINYLTGSSSTNLNMQVLATKNFANKKVFCNFW